MAYTEYKFLDRGGYVPTLKCFPAGLYGSNYKKSDVYCTDRRKYPCYDKSLGNTYWFWNAECLESGFNVPGSLLRHNLGTSNGET